MIAPSETPAAADDVLAILDAEDTDGLPPAAMVTQEAAARVAADRYLHALAGVHRKIDAAEDEYRAYVAHLTEVHGARVGRMEKAAAWLQGQLHELFAFIPTGNAKSVKLLAGTLGERHHEARLAVRDAAALMAWIRRQDEPRAAAFTVTSTPKPVTRANADSLLGYVLQTGDVPDGCELIEAGATFYAKPAEPGKIAGSIEPSE